MSMVLMKIVTLGREDLYSLQVPVSLANGTCMLYMSPLKPKVDRLCVQFVYPVLGDRSFQTRSLWPGTSGLS